VSLPETEARTQAIMVEIRVIYDTPRSRTGVRRSAGGSPTATSRCMKYRRPGLLGYPSPIPTIRAQQRRQLAAYIIKDVLAAAGRRIPINAGSVSIRDRLIFFDTRTRRALSKAVYGRMFPRIRRGKFFHYTGIEALQDIAVSGELRLYSLRKRMQAPIEGELMNLARIAWKSRTKIRTIRILRVRTCSTRR
jgi:hypothetical protein